MTDPAAIVSIVAGPPLPVRPGDRTRLRVPVQVAGGFHVQANPAASEFLVPLELRFERTDGVVPGPTVYPPGKAHRIEGAEDDLLVYDGAIVLEIPIDVDVTAAQGPTVLSGSLRYQACDRQRCLAPSTLALESTVVVRP